MSFLCWFGFHKYAENILSKNGWMATIVTGNWVRECSRCKHKEYAP